jgi:hypothetical protein
MSKLDVAKEPIAYLKFWLGIMIAVVVYLASRDGFSRIFDQRLGF